MLIGGDFNKKCEELLNRAVERADGDSDAMISVTEVNDTLGYDRNEIKSYLDYLSDRGLLKIESIGGPLLYGHITVTKKGIAKITDLKKRRNNR
jgi:uncharacterized membrane protein YvbJ